MEGIVYFFFLLLKVVVYWFQQQVLQDNRMRAYITNSVMSKRDSVLWQIQGRFKFKGFKNADMQNAKYIINIFLESWIYFLHYSVLTLTATAFKAMLADTRLGDFIPSWSEPTSASTIPILANLLAYP